MICHDLSWSVVICALFAVEACLQIFAVSVVHRSTIQVSKLTAAARLMPHWKLKMKLTEVDHRWPMFSMVFYHFWLFVLHICRCGTCSTMTLDRSVHAATMEPFGDTLNANTAKETTRSPKAFRFTRIDSCTVQLQFECTSFYTLVPRLKWAAEAGASDAGHLFSILQPVLVDSSATGTGKEVQAGNSASKRFMRCPADLENTSQGRAAWKSCTMASH